MKIQAIIFDFGGVLLNWDPYHLYQRFFPSRAAVAAFLHEIHFSDWNRELDRGRTFAEGVRRLSAEFPEYTDLIQAYDHAWETSINGQIEGTVEILNQLHRSGFALYGLSNFPGEKFHLVRSKFEFFNRFDQIFLSSRIQLLKPDPAIYHFVLAQIGLTAPECVFIDDSIQNVAAAQKLGFVGLHFQSPGQLAAELRQLNLFKPEFSGSKTRLAKDYPN